ncbi:MAG: acyl-ACP--UDP-N-acetylglucosamine O-acyltransferase [Candidatus Aminicenantales bacterium]
MCIHPTAIVNPKAKIADRVEIGPFSIIEDEVEIAAGVKIGSHVWIRSGTSIDTGTSIHKGAIIGHEPQDLAFKGKPSFVKIGKNNIIREYTTIHRGTEEGSSTVIGDSNFFMAFSHVGHNCHLGNEVILVNGVLLGGYVTVEDRAFISGHSVVHQFVRIGKVVMVGGLARVTRDIPPYMLVKGDSLIHSMNIVGMRRAGLSEEVRTEIKKAYKILYRMNLNVSQALERMEKELKPLEEIRYLMDFIRNSKRGICSHV